MDGNIRGGTLLIRTVGDQSEVEVSGTRMDIIFNWTALTNQICQTIGAADCPRCHVAGADQRLPAQCPQVRNQNGGESGG